MQKLSTEQKVTLFNNNVTTRYKKKGKFLFRDGQLGETILTVVAGKLETIKIVDEPSTVLRNIELGSSAETYVVPMATFHKRYDKTDQIHVIDGLSWKVAFAKGEVDAFEYKGETIAIMAIWNEEMLVEDGDFIARPVGGQVEDIYRIERQTFFQTYYEVVKDAA